MKKSCAAWSDLICILINQIDCFTLVMIQWIAPCLSPNNIRLYTVNVTKTSDFIQPHQILKPQPQAMVQPITNRNSKLCIPSWLYGLTTIGIVF